MAVGLTKVRLKVQRHGTQDDRRAANNRRWRLILRVGAADRCSSEDQQQGKIKANLPGHKISVLRSVPSGQDSCPGHGATSIWREYYSLHGRRCLESSARLRSDATP